jgi:hypothetical protein
VYFFLTDKCIGISKSLGVWKFCQNNKFPDKSSAGLTRLDCIMVAPITETFEKKYKILKNFCEVPNYTFDVLSVNLSVIFT